MSWSEVWECPECGTQVAAGDEDGVRVSFHLTPKCQLAHPPREMEQKLSQALPTDLRDPARLD
jgi:hypothetical protein